MPIERITAERIARHDLGWKRPNGEIDMRPLEALCGPDGLTPLELIQRVGNEYGGHKLDAAACIWVFTRPGMLPEEVTEATMVRTVERAIRRVLPICNDPTWRTWADRWLAEEDRSAESARVVAIAMQYAWPPAGAKTKAAASAAWAAWEVAAGCDDALGVGAEEAVAAAVAWAAWAAARAAGADLARTLEAARAASEDAASVAFATHKTATRAFEAASEERRLQVADFRAEIERFEEHPQ